MTPASMRLHYISTQFNLCLELLSNCMWCVSACIEQKKILCSYINKMLNVKNEISKEQDIVISLCVHSDSISLKISLCNLSALFWLLFRSRTKNHTVSILSAMSVVFLSFPSLQGLGKRTQWTAFLRALKFALAHSPVWGRFSALKNKSWN